MRSTHFIQSRPEQLADYLRNSITRGELVEPLPNIRNWSARLGVGRGTLELALGILKRDGLVRIRPQKGIDILQPKNLLRNSRQPRVVRWIAYGRDFPDISGLMEIFEAVSAGLEPHGIRFSIEKCNSARLKAIHRRGERSDEMFLLASLPKNFQNLFADFQRSALVNGLPFPEVQLPFISIDVLPAIRHAIHTLAQHGFSRVSLVIKEGSRQPLDECFKKICDESPHFVRGEVVRLPEELREQSLAARRLAARITGRHGVVVNYPIPASVLMTALMKKGVAVPEQVEVVAINTTLQAIRTVPVPAYYLFPVQPFARAVCQAAMHYFKQGALPPLRKMIPLKLLSPKVI